MRIKEIKMIKRLLVVCGPTSSGKTNLALHLAKLFDGELISADSRQVYSKMDIGTGKDLPPSSRLYFSSKSSLPSYYLINGCKIWGLDLVSPNEEFNVSRYLKITNRVIKNLWQRRKLPILVGGTGLYIKAVIDGIPTSSVPKDSKLRKKLLENLLISIS